MSALSFFTDLHLLADAGAPNGQTAGDEYGPLGQTQFRLNSLHKSKTTAEPTAYAVTKGVVLIHDIGDGQHVNLILEPKDQPSENSGIGVPRIKYFIYRHVQRSSLLVAGSSPEKFVPKGTIDLVDEIRDKYGDKNAPEVPVDGFLTSGAATATIASLFAARQLHPVAAGKSIGCFDPNMFGFEILLDDVGFEPDLALAARNPHQDCIWSVPAPSSSNADQFTARAKREYVLHFLDPCAFYGNSYLTGLRVNNNGNVEKIKGRKPEDRDKLYPILKKFLNHDKAYIDIRNENNHSYNYYRFVNDAAKKDLFSIYSSDLLEVTFTNDAAGKVPPPVGPPPPPANYYDSGGWPLLIVKNSDFPTGNTKEKNVVSIAMPRGNNGNATLFASVGIRNGGDIDGRLTKRTQIGNPHFVDLKLQSAGSSYEPFELVIPNNSTSGVTAIIPTYSRVKYLRRVADVDLFTDPADTDVQYLDNLFVPLLLKGDPGSERPVTYETEQYVDLRNGDQITKLEYVGNTLIEYTPHNVTLCCYPVYERRRDGSTKSGPTLEAHIRAGTLERYLSAAGSPKTTDKPAFIVEKLLLPPDHPNLAYYRRTRSILPRWLRQRDFCGVVLVTLNRNNFNDKILGPISGSNAGSAFSTDFDVHLVIRNQSHRDLNPDNDKDTSPSKIDFGACSLFLRGFKLNGSTGAVEVAEVNTGVRLYAKREPNFTVHPILRDGDAALNAKSPLTAYGCNFLVSPSSTRPEADEDLADYLNNIYKEDLVDFIKTLYDSSGSDLTSRRLYRYVFSKYIKTVGTENSLGLREPLNYPQIDLNFDSNGVLTHGNIPVHEGLLLEGSNYFSIWKITQGLIEVAKRLNDIDFLFTNDYDVKVDKLTTEVESLLAKYPFVASMVEGLKEIGVRSPLQIVAADRSKSVAFKSILVNFAAMFIHNHGVKATIGAIRTYYQIHDHPLTFLSYAKVTEALTALDVAKQTYVEALTRCVYQRMGGTLTDFRLLNVAIGDGSSTLGLFGRTTADGVFLFQYFYNEEKALPLTRVPLAQQSISDHNDDAYAVHLGIYGINQTVAHEIAVLKSDGTYASGFETATSETVDRFRFLLEQPLSFRCAVPAIKGIGSWNNFTKDLLIEKPRTNGYRSLAITLDSKTDEQTFSIILYKTIGPPADLAFAKTFEDLFADDVFVLTSAQKDALWNDREIEALKSMLETLKGEVSIRLVRFAGGGIGRLRDVQSLESFTPGATYLLGTEVVSEDGVYRALRRVEKPDRFNPSQWLLQPRVETDPDYVFHPPASLSSLDPWTRAAEDKHKPAAGSQLEQDYARLRYSYASMVYDLDAKQLDISVESYASPVFSRLDEERTPDPQNPQITAGLTANQWLCLNKPTIYEQNDKSNAYVKNVAPAPGRTVRDAYNPLLSALRSSALLDALLERLQASLSANDPFAPLVAARLDAFRQSASVNLTENGPGVNERNLDLVTFKKIAEKKCP